MVGTVGFERPLANGPVVSGVFWGVGAIDPGPPAVVIGTEDDDELILNELLRPMSLDRGQGRAKEL